MTNPAPAISGDPALQVSGLRKHYGSEAILDIEALRFEHGESAVLVGSNGSGKSTLLRVLAGAALPDHGKILRTDALAHRRLGYVPQSGGLRPEFTVEENLRLRRSLFGLADEPPARSRHVEELGLGPFLPKRFRDLSGGFQRLAAFAAAMHVGPSWLLLDEPLAGVDAQHRQALEGLLARVRRSLALVVVAAPAEQEAPDSDRVIRMVNGGIS